MNDSAIKLEKIIEKALEEGKIDVAFECFDVLEKYYPEYEKKYSIISTILLATGQYDESIEMALLGINLDQYNGDLLYNLAVSYERKEKFYESWLYYKRFLREESIYIDGKYDLLAHVKKIRDKVIRQHSKSDVKGLAAQINRVLIVDVFEDDTIFNITKEMLALGICVDVVRLNTIVPTKYDTLPLNKLMSFSEAIEILDYVDNERYNYVCFRGLNEINIATLKKAGYDFLYFDNYPDNVFQFLKEIANKNYKSKIVEKSKETMELTVLLPTYNRPENFELVMKHFRNYQNLKCDVIILDSSNDDNKIKNKEILSNLDNVEYKYFEFDSHISYVDKMTYGFKEVSMKYFSICPDDDFFSEEGLIKSIEILNEDATIFSAKGKNLYYTTHLSHLIEYDWFSTLDNKSAYERLKRYTSGFASALAYQVFRTDMYLDLWAFFLENKEKFCTYDAFLEYLFNFLYIMTGKIIKYNMDLNIRNKGINRQFSVKNFDQAVKDNAFNDEFLKMKVVLKAYSKHIGEDLNDIQIDELFSRFLIKFLCVPKEHVLIDNGKFDEVEMLKGMKKSWVWR